MPQPQMQHVRSAPGSIGEASSRQSMARRALEVGLFCMPALLLASPWGLTPFAAFALLALLLAPGTIAQGWREVAGSLRLLIGLALLVVAVVLCSKFQFDVRWREADNRLRLLTLPFFALMVYAYRPSRRWLWAGALVGLAGAFALALYQVLGGLDRALGWTANAIVFADALIALIVLAVFCRPPGELLWTTLACALGVAAVAALWVAPLAQQTRMHELLSDVDRLRDGDTASSLGARVTLLELAGTTFVEHPLTGVGVGSFEQVVMATPQCAPPTPRIGFCKLGHAHSDVPEWAATMGLPGLIAILGIYLLPLALFARRLRERPEGRSRSTALAGLVLVLVYITCGLTQSMFAHQLIASLYAAAIGVLYGFSLRESRESVASAG